MFEWTYDGVDVSIPRNAGPECAYYISPHYRIIETSFVSILIISLLVWGYKRLKLPSEVCYADHDRVGRRILLLTMSLVLGMEISFKLTSRTLVYLFNPCHVTTAVQLYLLAAAPSPMVTTLFRIHLNFLNGPVLAYLFPETESRGVSVYNVEPLSDMSWIVFSYGLNLVYHFWILQALAWPIQVNLSHMLCPAVLDPFEGQYYRLWTVVHQGLLCPLLCKLFCYGSNYFLTKFSLTKVKPSLEYILPKKRNKYEENRKLCESTSNTSGNGHTHVN
ncbi:transmembrane protein 164 isoform X3 [Lasioglossum baleicum]|uniref:transmembrane protein 164 isoform X3 n=1 Tax=Lasioglossum baleicum TaxID=434251 RepID=UPI003FCD5F10